MYFFQKNNINKIHATFLNELNAFIDKNISFDFSKFNLSELNNPNHISAIIENLRIIKKETLPELQQMIIAHQRSQNEKFSSYTTKEYFYKKDLESKCFEKILVKLYSFKDIEKRCETHLVECKQSLNSFYDKYVDFMQVLDSYYYQIYRANDDGLLVTKKAIFGFVSSFRSLEIPLVFNKIFESEGVHNFDYLNHVINNLECSIYTNTFSNSELINLANAVRELFYSIINRFRDFILYSLEKHIEYINDGWLIKYMDQNCSLSQTEEQHIKYCEKMMDDFFLRIDAAFKEAILSLKKFIDVFLGNDEKELLSLHGILLKNNKEYVLIRNEKIRKNIFNSLSHKMNKLIYESIILAYNHGDYREILAVLCNLTPLQLKYVDFSISSCIGFQNSSKLLLHTIADSDAKAGQSWNEHWGGISPEEYALKIKGCIDNGLYASNRHDSPMPKDTEFVSLQEIFVWPTDLNSFPRVQWYGSIGFIFDSHNVHAVHNTGCVPSGCDVSEHFIFINPDYPIVFREHIDLMRAFKCKNPVPLLKVIINKLAIPSYPNDYLIRLCAKLDELGIKYSIEEIAMR